MGVYIPNMKIPTACVKCRFCSAFECFAGRRYIKDRYKRNDDCPLVEVKVPHGRLIDADKARCTYMRTGAGYNIPIIEAETVLEAEEKDDVTQD